MSNRASPRHDAADESSDEPFVSIRNLKTYYDSSGIVTSSDPVRAVDGVSLDIHEGETVGLVGESGSGKTTLGRTLLRLEDADAGTVEVEGRDVTALSGDERREWQQKAAFVFQDPEESMNERMTVGEIVREPLEVHDWPTITVETVGQPLAVAGDAVPAEADTPDLFVDVTGSDLKVTVRDRLPLRPDDIAVERDGDTVAVELRKHPDEIRQDRVFDLLAAVGLNEEHYYRYPHQFSGGQRQRVGIARALALDPELLVLDEPVSALDVSVQARIINLLEELQDDLGLTYLFIAHDLSVVRHIADRVAVMYLGTIVESGPAADIFTDPEHPYTVSLLSAIPGSGSPWDGDRITLRGTPPSPRDPPAGCPFATRCPAKIRPDDWDIPEATWRALDTLYAVFRTRARSETSAVDYLNRLLGREIDSSALTELRSELIDTHELPEAALEIVESAFETARHGDDEAAAAEIREAFSSRCDAEHPDPEDGPRTNRCLRREHQYDDALTTLSRRSGDDDAGLDSN
ncbi:ABC-type oligopeptide transport system, ATPase component [Halapricum desulfuricans]|uniref:ABC-type oligopeptide transport system, ATPase component n=1 Tax=Halapricum desulfuricans TaxID=2841257 RepID=A0A897NIB3_9EURY|nr:ABC transporter ATP-binding protein [Halapricum desulfuricans]QSG10629.1 ABC-type oligopeptide transport system, ATPase component [Halapricum desulfuricans]